MSSWFGSAASAAGRSSMRAGTPGLRGTAAASTTDSRTVGFGGAFDQKAEWQARHAAETSSALYGQSKCSNEPRVADRTRPAQVDALPAFTKQFGHCESECVRRRNVGTGMLVPDMGTAGPGGRGSRQVFGTVPRVSRRGPPRRRSCRLRGRAPRRSCPRSTGSGRRC